MTISLDTITIISASFLVYIDVSLLTTCLSSLLKCHDKPLTPPHPTKPLFGYVTALLSPSYSVASCRCSCRLFHGGTWISWTLLGYHNISYLINASIYLVKGGRLGLMPGILFHSCRLSFRHTGVMFLDFAFLTRLGLWEPLDSLLWIKLL